MDEMSTEINSVAAENVEAKSNKRKNGRQRRKRQNTKYAQAAESLAEPAEASREGGSDSLRGQRALSESEVADEGERQGAKVPPVKSDASSSRLAKRIHLGSRGYVRHNALEGEPNSYRAALQQAERYVSGELSVNAKRPGRGKRLQIRSNTVGADEARTVSLQPLAEGHFSVIYCLEAEKYRVGWGELSRYLQDIEGVSFCAESKGTGNPSFVYYNELTGVRAIFRGYQPENDSPEIGLEFSMQLPCPQFYATEALPLAVRLAREFFFVTLWRNGAGDKVPVEASTEGLRDCWLESCRNERQRLAEGGRVFSKARVADMDAVWEYQYLSRELQSVRRKCECEILPVEYVRRKRTGEVQRLCRWSEFLPAVFPPVDLVMLSSPPKPLRDGKIVTASELFSKVKEWIKTEAIPITHTVFMHSELPEGLMSLVQGLKGMTLRSFEALDVTDIDDM